MKSFAFTATAATTVVLSSQPIQANAIEFFSHTPLGLVQMDADPAMELVSIGRNLELRHGLEIIDMGTGVLEFGWYNTLYHLTEDEVTIGDPDGNGISDILIYECCGSGGVSRLNWFEGLALRAQVHLGHLVPGPGEPWGQTDTDPSPELVLTTGQLRDKVVILDRDSGAQLTLLQTPGGELSLFPYSLGDHDQDGFNEVLVKSSETSAGSEFRFYLFQTDGGTAGIDDAGSFGYGIQIAPNPTDLAASVSYELPARVRTQVRVVDVSGRLVRSLVDEDMEAGIHQTAWDGCNQKGRQVGSGVYFVQVQTADGASAKRVTIVR